MSKIAFKWASSIQIKNPTEKKLLEFYARNHTQKNQIQISLTTLTNEIKVSRQTIVRAKHKLIEKDLIRSINQFDENGGQLVCVVSLNIPQTFTDEHQQLTE